MEVRDCDISLMKKQLIQKLKDLDVVYKGPVKLKHAGDSRLYANIKKAYGYPDLLNLISDCLWEMIDKKTTCIAAMGYGSISPASVISANHNLKLTMIREKKKNYGMKRRVDGYVPGREDYVSIVDDVATTGKTLKDALEVLGQFNPHIAGVYAVVKRGDFVLDSFQWLFTLDEII